MSLGPFAPIPPREKIRRSHINDLRVALTGIQDAYDVAVANGFTGTRGQWLDSLKGEKGDPGAGLAPIGSAPTADDFPMTGNTVGDVRTADDTGRAYRWDGSEWIDVGLFRGPGGEDTELRARVDPGTTGSVGQYPVIGPGGPAWMDEPRFTITHPRYGAKADGTDNTAVFAQIVADVKAAGGGTIEIPGGTFRGNWVIDTPNVRLVGLSRGKSRLHAPAGDLITLSGANRFSCEHLFLSADAGHIVEATKGVAFTSWYDLNILQNSPDHSVLNVDDTNYPGTFDYIDNLWHHVETVHSLSATVPTFNLRGLAINRNTFSDIRPTYSGTYVWNIEATGAAAFAFGNVIRSITGEILNGGIVRLRGARGTVLDTVESYDMGTTTRDQIVIENSGVSPSLAATGTTLINCRRIGGTLGSGLYDVNIQPSVSSTSTTFLNCGYTSSGYQINANSKRCHVIDGEGITVANDSGTQYIRSSTAGSRFISPVSFRDGLTLPKYTTAARPSAATQGEGAVIYDTTLGKPIWSNGTNWTDATGTVV